MNKVAGILTVIVVVGIGAYLYGVGVSQQQTPEQTTDQSVLETQQTATTTLSTTTVAQAVVTEESAEVIRTDHAIAWMFTDEGEDIETLIPMTAVTVEIDGTSYAVGTYEGSCVEIESDALEYALSEIAGAMCWWAGAGDEVRIFAVGTSSFEIRHAEIQEGSAEENVQARTEFETLLSVPQ